MVFLEELSCSPDGFMVVCEAGVGFGEHWVPVVISHGHRSLGEVVNNGCRDPALQKMGPLSAPPLSAQPILMLFLLDCYTCIHVLPRASFLDLICTNR